jgi:hypothetical protein
LNLNNVGIQNSAIKPDPFNGEIENYSVAEQAEEGFSNLFLLQLGALLKKKLTL